MPGIAMDGMTSSLQFGTGLVLTQSNTDEIKASVKFDSDSPWFSGHFPDDPVLPGIAQIGTVFAAIQKSRGEKLGVTGLSRVKFKKIVRPGDLLSIQATPAPGKPGAYSFRILVDAQEVCTGNMKVALIIVSSRNPRAM